MVGGKGIVAALSSEADAVTIWSSQGEMNQLHFFNGRNFHCPNDSCRVLSRSGIKTIQVVGTNKVAILSNTLWWLQHNDVSLVVLEKGNCTWETKVLGCFPIEGDPTCCRFPLASDGDWLAFLDIHKVKLWRGKGQEIVSPELDQSDELVSIFLELPHLVLAKRKSRSRVAWIMVYKMEDTDTVPCLIKSINLEMREPSIGNFKLVSIANQFCLGFTKPFEGGMIVHQFTKKELVSADLSPDETERREIRVEGDKISMNSTCFVAAVKRQNPGFPPRHDLWKNDLWMKDNIL